MAPLDGHLSPSSAAKHVKIETAGVSDGPSDHSHVCFVRLDLNSAIRLKYLTVAEALGVSKCIVTTLRQGAHPNASHSSCHNSWENNSQIFCNLTEAVVVELIFQRQHGHQGVFHQDFLPGLL
ncbi:hypothetical protein AV530_015148 [Patagioenas fasciata monilis]|uniref:Uncharacterized protein n=1 Tax=Patagioenas fasciata monilis TaxID=372326 RepID=A0A1V4K1C7_PATFA|nr:hypothetical protein AV530_015148 [Patagioenas fasciata monilis]